MERKENSLMKNAIIKTSATVLVLAVMMTSFYLPFGAAATSAASNPNSADSLAQSNHLGKSCN